MDWMGDEKMTDEKRTLLKERVKIKALAKQVNCNYTYLSAIINGLKKPSVELAARLAQACSYMTSTTYTIEDFRG